MFIFFVYKTSIFFSQLSENLSLIGSKKFGSFQHPHLQEISWFLSIKRVPRRNNLGRINSHFLLIKSIIVSSAFSTKTIIYIYVNCGHTSHGALFIIENRAVLQAVLQSLQGRDYVLLRLCFIRLVWLEFQPNFLRLSWKLKSLNRNRGEKFVKW